MRKPIPFFLTLIIPSLLLAGWVDIPANYDRELFEITADDGGRTQLTFALGGYELEPVLAGSRQFQQIGYPGEGEFLEVGKPDLPRFTRLIIIPDRGEVSYQIGHVSEMTVPDLDIYPRQPLQSESQSTTNRLALDAPFYRNGEPFPSQIVELGEPAILRDLRVVPVTVNPFQYDPRRRTLRVIEEIEITVTTSGPGGINAKTSWRQPSRAFRDQYRAALLNYESRTSREQAFQPPCYMFIYPDNATILTNLQPLLDWKRRKGYDVHVASTAETGTSSYSIRNYIQDAYDTWSNPPAFVCLVGDAEGSYSLPTGYMDGGEGDIYYVLLEGNDILADAHVGRLSIDNITHLQTIVHKILHYEMEPYLTQTEWYNRALVVGDPTSSGPSVVDTKRQVADMISYHAPNIVPIPVYSGSWVYHISTNINNGVSYFNYRGYYNMSGWDNGDINALNNFLMLPAAVFLTCDVGSFASGEARSETFLRAGTPANPKGAIGAIATATASTHTCFNNIVDMGIYGGIFAQSIYNLGGALNYGKLVLYQSYPQNPSNWVNRFSYWNNLMGDPGLELWTSVPRELSVDCPQQVPLGSNYLEVTVTDDTGMPVQEAWVALLQEAEGFYSSGLTGSDGTIILPVDAAGEGEVLLTITKHDCQPHLDEISVVAGEIFVNSSTYTIDDDNSGSSSGNNDGIINPSEQIELGVSLQNFGSVTASAITATLTSASNWVTITDDFEEYGDIPPGGSLFSSDDFDFTVAANAVEGSEIRLDLEITDELDTTWSDLIYLYVAGPYLNPTAYNVIGGDGRLDPGETAELEVTVANIGSVGADAVSGLLVSDDPRITVNDGDGYYGSIAAGGQTTNSDDRFEVTASTILLPGTQIPLKLFFDTPAGYDHSGAFILEIGTVTITDPLGPDAHGYCCYDDGDVDYYNAPVYNWIEINPDLPGHDYVGNPIPLNDSGDNGAIWDLDFEDEVLAFLFRFYGEEYTSITICSNGWICPGGTDNKSFMNWPIPGPGGPSPIIAPFWDDLSMSGGDVFWYFSEPQHYLVVEWSQVRNDYNNAEETFQVILYDPNYYPTSTGDSPILFQYKEVNNVDVGSYSSGWVLHGQYATVGIEDPSGTIGLEYTFNNSYPTACKELENEMALLFTGSPVLHEGPFLVLGEVVIEDAGDNGQIDYGEQVNLQIALNNMGQETASGVSATLSSTDPYLTLTGTVSGYPDIESESSAFNLVSFSFDVSPELPDGHLLPFQLQVTCGEEVWDLNFTLAGNAPVVQYASLFIDDDGNHVLDPGETVDIMVTYRNIGGSPVENVTAQIATEDEYLTINVADWEFEIIPAGGSQTAVYNVTADAEAPVGHVVEVNWTVAGDNDYTATGIIALAISQVPVYMTEDFASWPPDGWSTTSSSGQINWGHSNTANAGGTAPEALFFWNPSTVAVQRLISSVLNTLGHTELELEFKHRVSHYSGAYALRLETTSDGGATWHEAASWPNADLGPRTEQLILNTVDVGSEAFQVAWVFDGDSYNINDWSVDDVVLGSIGYGLIEGTVILDGGDGVVTEVLITAGDFATSPNAQGDYLMFLPAGTYDVAASLEGYESEIFEDVELPIDGTIVLDFTLVPLQGVEEAAVPLVTSLTGNYPNPFNPETTIDFGLARDAADVRIAVYNIRGQHVNTLVNGPLPAGYHQALWRSTNSSGNAVASGMYIYQLRVDGQLIGTRKMVLIR